jgi:Zn-finger nucleic acid-binding protein
MRTFNRNGVQIEQCDGCRGIFLDYGELEALSRLESQWAPPPPAPPPAPMHAPPVQYGAPAWGAPHHHYKHGHYHHKSFVKMLFSS